MRSTFINYSLRLISLSTKTASCLTPNYWGTRRYQAQRISSALRIELARMGALGDAAADDIGAQIGTQDPWDEHTAVRLLVILQDCDHHARSGEAAAI